MTSGALLHSLTNGADTAPYTACLTHNRETKMTPAILWFRRNLRLGDNLAVIAAAESGHPVLPVYVLDELDSGPASRWWLHHSLAALDNSLRQHGSSLLILKGAPEIVLDELIEYTGAEFLSYCRRYEPVARAQEEALISSSAAKIEIQSFNDGYLNPPEPILTKGGTPFRVFTPYWNTASRHTEISVPKPVPDLLFAAHDLKSLSLADLKLLPVNPDWACRFHDTWTPGEDGALQRLDSIEEAVRNYGSERDRPDMDTTSHLSPHLHFGEVSVRQVANAIRISSAGSDVSEGGAALQRQLYWRDFSAYLLFHFPSLPEAPLRGEFKFFPWSSDSSALEAWQLGMTGYPIVDAGMRQLWATGWMHNRVRMIVASFLVKDLLIPWQQGADWFLDTLVDADLANNSASWQWVTGCGTDAAPYFRIFNPTLQGKKFDPNGWYVRRWVPELTRLPTKYVHEPWRADSETQSACGVVIGQNYPEPIVDHGVARKNALAAYHHARDRNASGDGRSDPWDSDFKARA